MQSKKRTILRIAAIILCVAALALIGTYSFYRLWEAAPAVDTTSAPIKHSGGAGDEEEMDSGIPFDTERQDGVYTIALAGSDNGTGNTDAIMVGRIDTVNHKMEFVSIPRDTVINMDWSIRKLNSVYWGAKNNGGDGPEALKMHLRWLTGFNVDCYAVIDLSAFADTIDALGGIDVNVKQAISYQDPAQGIYLDVAEGKQHLGGYESLCYVRYRAGYITGDLGRIETQHDFLRDVAKQVLSLDSIPNASKIVDILSERTDTNLTGPNIAFFLRQAMKCKSEDVSFYTMPNTSASFQGYSYAVPLLGEWLEMINAHLNPYETPVSASNLNMVFMSGRSVGCTGTMKGAWYYEAPPEPSPTPAASPTPIVSPSPEAGPTSTPEPTASAQPTETPPSAEPTPPEATLPPTEAPSTPVPTEEPGVTPAF